jgi:transketolase
MPSSTDARPAHELAQRIRRHVLAMTHRARSSHVGGGFSVAEILAVLYGGVLRVDSARPNWAGRDRLIYSKGHACAALYAALAETGFFPVSLLETFYADGSSLLGHCATTVPGIEYSTGSLGHGLPVACGMALAAKRDGASHRIYAILSDGECDEGTTWEAALFAAQHRLDNLTVIVDYNKIQSLGRTDEVLSLEPFAAKWQAFRWTATEVDGHDVVALGTQLGAVPHAAGAPTVVIAHTVKGKGVSFMEGDLLWHYRSPDDDEYRRAADELGRPS